MVGMTPRRSRPLIGRSALRAHSARSSASASSRRARATTSVPTGVIMTECRSRSTRQVPSAASSSLIPADSVDWVTKQASAAWVKFSLSDTATR